MPRLSETMNTFNPIVDIEWLSRSHSPFWLRSAKLVKGEYEGKPTESWVFAITVEVLNENTGEMGETTLDLWLGRTTYRDSLAEAVNKSKPEPIGPCIIRKAEATAGRRATWVIEDYPDDETPAEPPTPGAVGTRARRERTNSR